MTRGIQGLERFQQLQDGSTNGALCDHLGDLGEIPLLGLQRGLDVREIAFLVELRLANASNDSIRKVIASLGNG